MQSWIRNDLILNYVVRSAISPHLHWCSSAVKPVEIRASDVHTATAVSVTQHKHTTYHDHVHQSLTLMVWRYCSLPCLSEILRWLWLLLFGYLFWMTLTISSKLSYLKTAIVSDQLATFGLVSSTERFMKLLGSTEERNWFLFHGVVGLKYKFPGWDLLR